MVSMYQVSPRLRREGFWDCVKSISPPAAAKYYFDRRVVFSD